MAEDPNGNFGLRMLIMIYALGIVILGAYPLQRNHGSVTNFVKKQIAQVRWENPFPALSAADFGTASRTRAAPAKIKDPEPQIKESREQRLDRINKRDRAKLKELFDGIE